MNEEKSRILDHPDTPRAFARRHLHLSLLLGAAALLGVVAAFGTVPDAGQLAGGQKEIVEPLTSPELTPAENLQAYYVREDQIQRGDTAEAMLSRLGVNSAAALNQLRALPAAAFVFHQMLPGKSVTARVDGDGNLDTLILPLSGDPSLGVFVERSGSGLSISEKPLPLDSRIVMKSGEIHSSLFSATDAAGIPDPVAIQLADIFGGDIDFHRGLKKGDRFSVAYEAFSHLGRPVRSGRIVAAEFVNAGKTYNAIWHGDSAGHGAYYAPDGTSLRKAFLRSPLEFSRITSGFSLARFHPILQQWRAHKGVDYGAPIGTRVKATADGEVEFAGVQGGYGNVIILRHQSPYSTVYGHLSRFAPGIRAHTRVRQGDVIGFVGMTGLATGPHLHYEFRIDGVYRDPLTFIPPPAPPLSETELAQFRHEAGAELARLDMMRSSGPGQID